MVWRIRLLLLIIVAMCSCNKKIYSERTDNSYTELTLVGKKNGQYRGLSALNRNYSGRETSIIISFSKLQCDTFYLFRHNVSSGKKNIQNTRFNVAKTGSIKADFTLQEIGLIEKCRKILDSLQWCNRTLTKDHAQLMTTEVGRK